MTSEYEFRQFAIGDLDLLSTLHTGVYGWAPPREVLYKKYMTGSLGCSVIGFFAIHAATKKVAAYYGVFPLTVNISARRVIAAQSGDTMTHPEHQGRGLFTTLAKMTYRRAGELGISIVFGFPNANSFPGFVRKLGWSHCYDMDSFTLWTPTLPLSEVWRLSKAASRFHRALAGRMLRRFAVKDPPALPGSIWDDNGDGVLRDENFYAYKSDGLYAVRVCGATVWIKLGKAFEIGDIAGLDLENSRAVVFRLKMLAALLGYPRLRTYCSPTSRLARILSTHYPAKRSLAYGTVSLDGVTSGTNLTFTYIDYDTF